MEENKFHISIFTSDMKQGKYDKIDLSRSIYKGNQKIQVFQKKKY